MVFGAVLGCFPANLLLSYGMEGQVLRDRCP